MPIPIDDFSPIYKGNVGAAFNAHFINQYTETSYSLTGATISMVMHEDDQEIVKAGTGIWVIDNPSDGRAHYEYHANDVNQTGLWKLYITITKSGEAITADPKVLEILPIPTP